ncbi:MAG: flagellar motor switch protein FliG [Gammaproteobacteria bacterium]|nr:flagellar motor switch protein FliG [Gammaproteobacteria bacterium]MDE2250133.1 flagellar motor switch protein FliG [Gammaproteobacteria bacterium]
MNEAAMNRPGVEQAAILLLTLGEQDAAQVLRHLGAKDVQRVGQAMAQLSGVSREEVSQVLGRFATRVEQQTSVGVNADEYVRKVLNEALGTERAGGVIDRILRGRSSRGLEAVKWMEPRAVAGMLRDEHPQVIAIVLSYLEAEQAALVLGALPQELQPDVIVRVASLDGVQPAALNELDEALEKQFTGKSMSKATGFGGPKAAAEILNLVGAAPEGRIIEEIVKTNADLGQQLQDLMFVFDDLIGIDDRGMQELLREIPGDKLIIAMKATTEELKEKFFRNMSERAAQMLKDDLEAKGPVKLSDVEAAQKEIILSARRMADEGKVQLGGKGGEEYV